MDSNDLWWFEVGHAMGVYNMEAGFDWQGVLLHIRKIQRKFGLREITDAEYKDLIAEIGALNKNKELLDRIKQQFPSGF